MKQNKKGKSKIEGGWPVTGEYTDPLEIYEISLMQTAGRTKPS